MRRIFVGNVVLTIVMTAGFIGAPASARADVSALRAAVVAAREGTSCPPYVDDAVVQQVSNAILESTRGFYLHEQDYPPIYDATPVLNEWGYPAKRSVTLFGFSTNEADAVRSVAIQGWDKIPDCSLTTIGASQHWDAERGFIITNVVLTTK